MTTNVPNGWVYTEASRSQNTVLMIPGQPPVTLWGTSTLQRKPTALDRVGIRRLMFYIEKQLRQIMRNYLPSGADLVWLDFDIFCFMEDIKERKGVVEYQFVADDDCIMLGICPRENASWIWTALTVG